LPPPVPPVPARQDHFASVCRCHEFLKLSHRGVHRLLASDELNVSGEPRVLDALLAWVRHDPAGRRAALPGLLAHVRLPLLPPQLLADLELNPLFREDIDCQRLLLEAMACHLLPESRALLHSPRLRPRKSTVGLLYAVGGVDAVEGEATVERFDVRRGRWATVGAMSGRRLQFGVALVEGALLVVGGRHGLKTLNSAQALCLSTGAWTQLPPMATHRHGLGVAVLGGPLYAVGGHDGWSYLSSVERWDPQTGRWSFVAPLGSARSTAGVAVLHGKLFAVGGRDGASCLRSVESYDPHADRWSPRAPLSVDRGGPGVAACHGRLYAVGGHNSPTASHGARILDCVERYDPQTDSWSRVSPLGVPRDAVGACVLGHRLYAVGGHDGASAVRRVQAYEALADTWVEVPSMCSPRAGACVVVVKST
uniref:Kelch-like protein 1 n=1 Tax=Petromyzon marinus TaxID=7757 RepID=A0AAJ7SKB5_PETMA